jgi:hypothetical protein
VTCSNEKDYEHEVPDKPVPTDKSAAAN